MTFAPSAPIVTRVNRAHSLAYGLKGWWLTSYGYTGGYWKDLTGLATAVSKGRTIAAGYNAPRAMSHSPGHVPHSCYLSSTGSTEFFWDTGLLTLNSVSAYTYSFWARRRSTGEFIQVGASHASSGRNTLLIHSADTTYLTWGTSYTAGTFASADVGWHHWTVVYDGTVGGGTCTAYKDGASFITHASSGATTTSNGGNTFIFGKEINAGYVSNGFINDIKVYNRALSIGEITNLYNNSRQGYRGLLLETPQVFGAAKIIEAPTIGGGASLNRRLLRP